MNYVWHSFDALSLEQVIEAFSDFRADFVEEGYKNWLSRYVRKANTFYRMQHLNYKDVALKDFMRQYNILHLDDFDHDEEWEAYKRDCGLEDYERALEKGVDQLTKYHDWLCLPSIISGRQVAVSYHAHILALYNDELHPHMLLSPMDELWFNTMIQTPPHEQSRLRAMLYGDYLKSDHWRRVRAAMLLIHRARCNRPHGNFDDGAWGEEFDMHVHHKTYANRGNERYDDLELLCFRCHAEEHDKTEKNS